MPIRQVTLTNYKSHVDTVVPVGDLTLLVGPNASGKTAVLEVVELLGSLPRRSFLSFVDEGQLTPKFADGVRQGAERFRVGVEGEAGAESWHLSFGAEKIGAEWKPLVEWQHGSVDGALNAETERHESLSTAVGRLPLPSCYFLHLDPTALARPCTLEVGQRVPALSAVGGGLAAVLGWLKLTDLGRFEAIVADLRRVVPAVEAVDVRTAQFREERAFYLGPDGEQELRTVDLTGLEVVFDMRGPKRLPARVMSEGTLVALGILTALRHRGGDAVLLIDGIDEGLHPCAQVELIARLRDVAGPRQRVQLLATTHSPYLVDAFAPEEVVVFGLRDDGTTLARPLSDHPDAARLLEVLSTGELLSAEGEGWLERPVQPRLASEAGGG